MQCIQEQDISPTRHFTDSLFTDTAFHRHDVSSTRPFTNMAFHRHGLSPTRPFTDTAFHWPPDTRPSPKKLWFTLSLLEKIKLSEVNYVPVCVILCTWVFSHRPNSDQVEICVLWFNANRVWLVSRLLYFFGPIYLQSMGVSETLCQWKAVSVKRHVGETPCRWNAVSVKRRVSERPRRWNAVSVKRRAGERSCRWNAVSVKGHVGEMPCRWKAVSVKRLSVKRHVGEMSGSRATTCSNNKAYTILFTYSISLKKKLKYWRTNILVTIQYLFLKSSH